MDSLCNLRFNVMIFGGLLLSLLALDSYGGKTKSTDSHVETRIRNEVNKYLGVKYRRGGSSKRGVDCSGFVRLIYRNVFGVDLPYIAAYQSALPIFKKVSVKELKAGDLIFFSPNNRKKRINHVGIYLSDGFFAHALSKRGVIISSLENRYWKSRIYTTIRYVTRKVEATDRSGTS